MACNITSGFTLGCRDNAGGIDEIYILSGSITSITEPTEGLATAITGSGKFYRFELPRNVGDFTEVPTPSNENGTVFYDQTINVAFHKLQSSIRNQVKVLAQNPSLTIVVKTNNGTSDHVGEFFLAGRYRGLTLSAGTGGTGTAFGDANQYALTFNGQEPLPFTEISTNGSLSSALSGITVSS